MAQRKTELSDLKLVLKGLLIFIIVMVLLVFLVYFTSQESGIKNAFDTRSTQSKVKTKISSMLKDGESAEFRNLEYQRASGVTCGEVNAKNSFGAMAGYARFISNGKNIAIIENAIDIANEQTGENGFASMWEAVCK